MNAPLPAQSLAGAHTGAHSLLRFITCGSVDDGKSTLIGRLLYECGAVFDDQLGALDRDSKKFGTQGENLDFALLVDGLSAEREQGITIDVAYRYFATPKRSFIVADTPGHEQYTRNMATGASTADLAILLIDARKGVLTQTRRHAFIASMLRVRHVALAVNKMDIVDFDRDVFERIVADFREAARELDFESVVAIPVSARDGDNVARRSPRTPWHDGPTLLEHLESLDVGAQAQEDAGFVLPVQWVNRPNLDFRGFAGTIAAGRVRPGDVVRALPSGRTSRVARIVAYGGDLAEAGAGQSITLTLEDEIDVSRGDALASAQAQAQARVGQRFAAHVFWTVEDPLRAGRRYVLKLAGFETQAQVERLHHAIDVNTYQPAPAHILPMNGVGLVTLSLDRPAVFADYSQSRDLGGFILIDRLTNETVAIGLVNERALAQTQTAHARPSPLRRLIERRFGLPGTRARDAAVRRLAGEGAGALFVFALAGALSESVVVGLAASAADALLRPALRRLFKRAQERRDQKRDLYTDGGGI
jgi:bifunctional enzyme CysN/CysC